MPSWWYQDCLTAATYPDSNDIVQDLLEGKETGLDDDGDNTHEVEGGPPDRDKAAEEEHPPPQLKVHDPLHRAPAHCHSSSRMTKNQGLKPWYKERRAETWPMSCIHKLALLVLTVHMAPIPPDCQLLLMHITMNSYHTTRQITCSQKVVSCAATLILCWYHFANAYSC